MNLEKGTYGYAGTILKINLTEGTIERIPTDKYSDKFIGGRSMGAAIYWDEVPPECGALDPENAIIWTCGPACGVLGPSPSRVAISTKSPATVPESYSVTSTGAGHWGAELRFAGFDGLIVTGKAENPVYIHITDDNAEILPANRLWGKTCRDTDNEIKRLWGVQTRVCQIGPAGENLDLCSAILTDFSHATGNGGFGAVMGSKNLKCVAVHGTGSIKVKDPKRVIELFHNKVYLEGPNGCGVITQALGAPWAAHKLWPADSDYVKTFNYGTSLEARWDPDSELGQKVQMIDDMKEGKCTYKFGGCWSCPMGCRFTARYTDIDIPTMPMNLCHQAHTFKAQKFALQSKLWGRSEYLWNGLCTDLGMTVDVFGTSNGWGNDLLAAGCLTEDDFNLSFDWSISDPSIWLDEQFIREFLHNLCYRKGSEKFNHLADGPTRCLQWFAEHDERAIPVYQSRCPIPHYFAHDGHESIGGTLPIASMSTATDVKFPHHDAWMRIQGNVHHFNMMSAEEKAERNKKGLTYYSKRLFGVEDAFGAYAKPEENTYTGKGLPAKWLQNQTMEMDSFSMCAWAGWPLYASAWTEDAIGDGGIATELFNAITGSDYYYEEFTELWNPGWSISRAIQAREGKRKEHDLEILEIPSQVEKKVAKFPDGAEGFKAGIEEYYAARGWDPETGIPTRSTLESEGLGYVADELESKYGIAVKD
ncbi:aldehyde ferredoxin oxidoreductase N-terminal domain-containing protein [Rubneribacter badeniensis]|uniref:aldehyde ferredoxin oxidoreductase N-terminal domain-containing protein n=1 Tax=Rubneribacter badeniensis TaxID=2070688 RepID=UPI003A9455A1